MFSAGQFLVFKRIYIQITADVVQKITVFSEYIFQRKNYFIISTRGLLNGVNCVKSKGCRNAKQIFTRCPRKVSQALCVY